MTFKIISSIIAAIALVLSTSANAILIGNGNTITDTDTNLNWFTLTGTTGYSYNQMLTNFSDVNSQFYGFTYATRSDLESLWGNAGYTGDFLNADNDIGNRNAINDLFNLFGQTGTSIFPRADGMYDDESVGDVGQAYLVPVAGSYSLAKIIENLVSPDDVDWPVSPDNALGSWIYKPSASVPEPSIALLMASGLIVFGVARRKKQYVTVG